MLTQARNWLGTVSERLLPDRLRGGQGDLDERALALVFVRAWFVGIAFGAAQVLIYMGTIWGQSVLNSLVVASGFLALWALRRGAPINLLVHSSLAVTALAFALGSLAQVPFDATSLYYLLIVPLFASFSVGARGAVGWSVACLVLGCVGMGLGFSGYTLTSVDAFPRATEVINFVFILTLMSVISISVHQLRERAFHAVDLSSKAKSAFLANMSHELRTPMNGVLGLTEVMLTEELSPSQRERLELVRRSGGALVQLIDAVLDLSRVESGKLSLEPAQFDLAALCQDVTALFSPAAAQKGVALRFEPSPGLPVRVRGDPLRLRQVLSNLVGNSVKFTGHGEIVLRLEPKGARIGFAVEDTGPGISAEALTKLYRLFEQGDPSTTRRFGGSGLGLALSEKLVALMEGKLLVASTVGVGTRFSFELVLEAVASTTAPPPATTRTPAEGRVLVVDDNAINLKVAAALVQKAGYQFATATNGLEALALFEREPFDLVLMDCHMPELDGFEATRRLRALDGPRASTPVVALTASAMPEDREACRRAGMNELLAKPISCAKLEEVLARLIRRPPASRETQSPV
jgi:signal transduction histidine kinase/CheY-like chemotaxis protein